MILEFKDIQKAIHTKKSDEEQHKIIQNLFLALAANPVGNSISCNQIGINDSRIMITNIGETLYFINPIVKTISSNELFSISETCLSLPNKIAKTKRFKWIEIAADNFKEPIIFGDYDNNQKLRNVRLNQVAALQKMLDILDGVSILDNQTKHNQIPVLINNKKIGRNEKVLLTKEGEIKQIKFKFIEPLLKCGWNLIENNEN